MFSAALGVLIGRVGLVSVLLAGFSIPLVSFLSYFLTLGVPFEFFTSAGFARYTFLLLSAILVSFAVARVFVFLISSVHLLASELFSFVRASRKISKSDLSELLIARYELSFLRVMDRRAHVFLSTKSHLRISLFVAVYFFGHSF